MYDSPHTSVPLISSNIETLKQYVAHKLPFTLVDSTKEFPLKAPELSRLGPIGDSSVTNV